jgi:hypothetical protein
VTGGAGPSPVHSAWRNAIARDAGEICATAAALHILAEACIAAARALREESARLRAEAGDHRHRTGSSRRLGRSLQSFTLRGTIEDHPVEAEWTGGRLVVHPLLLDRAQLLVAMGEQFLAGPRRSFSAALDGAPVVALLTLIRACDQVEAVEVGLPGPGPG